MIWGNRTPKFWLIMTDRNNPKLRPRKLTAHAIITISPFRYPPKLKLNRILIQLPICMGVPQPRVLHTTFQAWARQLLYHPLREYAHVSVISRCMGEQWYIYGTLAHGYVAAWVHGYVGAVDVRRRSVHACPALENGTARFCGETQGRVESRIMLCD